MIRRIALLASLFLASSAFASYNPAFSSSFEQLVVGETRTIYLRAVWSGFNQDFSFKPWVCGSDNVAAAVVEGGLPTLRSSGEVRLTAVAPGTAYVRFVAPNGNLYGGNFVKITVKPRPVSVSIAPSSLTTTVARSVTLVALSESPALTYTWYQGHLGDTTHPLGITSSEARITPTAVGAFYFWVSAVGANGMSSDEVRIDVTAAPRRRAAGPR